MRRLGKWQAIVFLALLGLSPSGLPAADGVEKPHEKAVGPFTGTVLDPDGKPAPGAGVWLVGGGYLIEEIGHLSRPAGLQVLAETSTDESGRFQLAEVKWEGRKAWGGSPTVVARDRRGCIGGQMPYSNLNAAMKRKQDVEIRLKAVKDLRGRLVDLAGQPIAAARIRPHTCVYQDRAFGLERDCLFTFPPQLSGEMTVESGPDGWFTLRGVPSEGEACFAISARGFGNPVARVNLARLSTTIQLGRAGDIRGIVTCGTAPEAAAGISIRINLDPRRTVGNADCGTSYSADGVTRKDGSFRFEGIPPGRYSVQPELAKTLPYYVEYLAPVEVKSGETAHAALTLKSAVKVRGKVVDQATGKGVADIGVSIYPFDRLGTGGHDGTVTTSADGTFSMYARPGKAGIHVYELPDQFARGSAEQRPLLKADVTLEPFVLTRKNVLEGIVVDRSGHPTGGVEIRVYPRNDMFLDYPYTPIHNDAAGKFTINLAAVNQVFDFHARTRNAAAEPVDVIPEQSPSPIRLVLDEKTSFAVRGIVVNDAGRPIPDAEIVPTVCVMFSTHGAIFQCVPSNTTADGKFEVRGLWPGAKYDFRVSAAGYDPCGSRQVEGTRGGVYDFGRITLIDAGGTIEGKVIDRSGKPLADVRVFNSGDGPRPMETQSDGAGRFRLQGFRKGPAYIFAEKEGYRFAGLRTSTGATDATLKLLPAGQQLPRKPPTLAAAPSDEEKELARKLQAKLLTAKARIAPPQRPLDEVAEADFDEALSMVPREGAQAYRSLKSLANHFAASDPAKAVRCAEEAALRARTLDQPDRTLRLAEIGVMVGWLGNKDAGEKLVKEAAAATSKWASGNHDREFGSLAAAAAFFDPSLAAGFLDKISDPFQLAVARVEAAAAARDLEKTESRLRDLEERNCWEACRVRLRLAYRIAPANPAAAARLIEDMPMQSTINNEGTKALVFSQLAAGVASRDPAMARSLIDRAFAIFLHPADRTLGYDGGRAAQAALTAVQARQIGYPDVKRLVYQVLATRPATADVSGRSPAGAPESAVVMAMFLALIDAPTARQVLQTIEPNSDAIGSSGSGVARGDWFKAWALADPRHAAELAEQEVASAKDPDALRAAQDIVVEMVGLWTTAPKDRLRHLSRGLLRDASLPEDY